MKILIGMEESQTICKAFRQKGHEAYSCDLKPCSGGHPEWHIQGDINELLCEAYGWEAMILHPECTRVCVSGNGTYAKGKEKYNERMKACDYIEHLWYKCITICNHVVFENPMGVLSTNTTLPKPQYIQPWQFGHMETKKTALFLHNLPQLIPTKNVYKEMMKLPKKERHRVWYASYKEKNVSEMRSKTYPGIAQAMVDQWTELKIQPTLF